jgi:hypothetical protein
VEKVDLPSLHAAQLGEMRCGYGGEAKSKEPGCDPRDLESGEIRGSGAAVGCGSCHARLGPSGEEAHFGRRVVVVEVSSTTTTLFPHLAVTTFSFLRAHSESPGIRYYTRSWGLLRLPLGCACARRWVDL